MSRKAKVRTSRHIKAIRRPPGHLEVPEGASETTVRVMRYDAESVEEHEGVGAIPLTHKGVLWVDVVGLASLDVAQTIAKRFNLHPLAMEDALRLHQRPKFESYAEHVYGVAKIVHLPKDGEFEVEQLSVFVTNNVVITFQEHEGDCFGELRRRIREGGGRIRNEGAPYLCYALFDALADSYFPVVEEFGERLETLEEAIFAHPEEEQLQSVHKLRRDLITLRRAAYPLREMVLSLVHDEHPLFNESVRLYLRDCGDHAIQVAELVDNHREHASSLLDIYLSSVGHRANEVMKVLTMIATIFIPLSFLVGLYGMNFDTRSPYNMPELSFRFGYPVLISAMMSLVVGMLYYFRKKRWI
ncbi:MAG: magnesium transporter [Polyangiales bacterium]|jgi:magnesium transporter